MAISTKLKYRARTVRPLRDSAFPSILEALDRVRDFDVVHGEWLESLGCGKAHVWPGACEDGYDPDQTKCVDPGEVARWPFPAIMLYSMLAINCDFDNPEWAAGTDRRVVEGLACQLTEALEWRGAEVPSLASTAQVLTKDSGAVSVQRGMSVIAERTCGRAGMMHGPLAQVFPWAPSLFVRSGLQLSTPLGWRLNPGPGWRGVIPLDDGGDGETLADEGEAYLYWTRDVPIYNFAQPRRFGADFVQMNESVHESVVMANVGFATCEVLAVKVVVKDIAGVTI